MKQKTLLITFFCLFFVIYSSVAFAQSDIVPSGGTTMGNGGVVSFTIGQIEVQSNGDGNTNISEGVQQPYEIQIVGVDNYPSITLNAIVYPNPTRGNVQLKIDYEDWTSIDKEVQIYDGIGKCILIMKIEEEDTEIPISDLATGTYFVNVIGDTRVLKSFKVVKTKY